MLGPLGVLEQERRPPGLDDAVDDLGDLEVGVDLGGDAPKLALALEERDPLAEVSGRRQGEVSLWTGGAGSTISKSRSAVPRRSTKQRRGRRSSGLLCRLRAPRWYRSPRSMTPTKMRPTTSIARMMSRPSSAAVLCASSTGAWARSSMTRAEHCGDASTGRRPGVRGARRGDARRRLARDRGEPLPERAAKSPPTRRRRRQALRPRLRTEGDELGEVGDGRTSPVSATRTSPCAYR